MYGPAMSKTAVGSVPKGRFNIRSLVGRKTSLTDAFVEAASSRAPSLLGEMLICLTQLAERCGLIACMQTLEGGAVGFIRFGAAPICRFCWRPQRKTLPDSFDSFPCNIQAGAFWEEGLAKNLPRLVRLVNLSKTSLEFKLVFVKINESNEPGDVFRKPFLPKRTGLYIARKRVERAGPFCRRG